MSAHTPGPWRFIERAHGMRPSVQRGGEGGFQVIGKTQEREDADARLIASAPDLLDALEACAAELKEWAWAAEGPEIEQILDRAFKVIAKCKGELDGSQE